MYLFKKYFLIIVHLIFSQIIGIKNKEFIHSFSKLFSFFRKGFRSDKLIESLISEINELKTNQEYNPIHLATLCFNSQSSFEINIQLLSKSIIFTDKSSWDIKSYEAEDKLFLQRFSWILLLVESKTISYKTFIKIIDHWVINNDHSGSKNNGWDAYSVSERVCNLIILINHYDICGKDLENFKILIDSHLSYLTNNLEFRGSSTNNHLLNNARALYIGGAFLNNEIYQSIGSIILKKYHSRVFSDSGMNREGSSHYQLIFTKWLLEVLWFAYYFSDTKTINLMKNRVRKALSASYFFLKINEFPFIGDISPDFALSYFMDLPQIGELIINGNIKKESNIGLTGIGLYLGVEGSMENKILVNPNSYHKDGYYLIQKQDLLLLSYVNPNSYISASSHAHSDIGSFILWHKGKIIMDDLGRSTYQNNQLGDTAKSVVSHNTLSINKSELFIVHNLNSFPELHTTKYIGAMPEAIYTDDSVTKTLKITHSAFNWFGKSTVISRRLLLQSGNFKILDKITGNGVRTVSTHFHAGMGLDLMINNKYIDRANFLLMNDNIEIASVDYCDVESTHLDLLRSNSSKKYGSVSMTDTIVLRQECVLPVINKYEFKFKI
jgi:hypothetical protein